MIIVSTREKKGTAEAHFFQKKIPHLPPARKYCPSLKTNTDCQRAGTSVTKHCKKSPLSQDKRKAFSIHLLSSASIIFFSSSSGPPNDRMEPNTPEVPQMSPYQGGGGTFSHDPLISCSPLIKPIVN